jgi:hypothetical protein
MHRHAKPIIPDFPLPAPRPTQRERVDRALEWEADHAAEMAELERRIKQANEERANEERANDQKPRNRKYRG